MLVLSRRAQQRIVFPSLDITVEVVQVKGNTVRLGIQAPADVNVARQEVLDQAEDYGRREHARQHELRGQLHTAMMALSLAEKQIQAGRQGEAEQTLEQALLRLETLEKQCKRQREPAQPIHALLVEDDVNEQALLASYLRMSGYRVESVQDGGEALDYLASQRPDFLLLDMGLPQVDGPATVAAVRQNPAIHDLTIFAVTGRSAADIQIPGPRGVDGWFQKPLNPARLVEAMTRRVSRN